MPPRKKRAAVNEDGDADEDFDPKSSGIVHDVEDEKPKKKHRAKKEKEPEGIHTAREGPEWTVVPPSVMYRCSQRHIIILQYLNVHRTLAVCL